MKGIIQKYVTTRGFGFIEGEDGKRYFFHITDTNLDPRFQYEMTGAEAEFEPVEKHEGLVIKTHAKNVQINADIDCMSEMKGETKNE